MLREWGVRGIRVNEVVPLDAIFDSSSASISGLIFLSRYNSAERNNEKTQIPPGLWFANQVCIVPPLLVVCLEKVGIQFSDLTTRSLPSPVPA